MTLQQDAHNGTDKPLRAKPAPGPAESFEAAAEASEMGQAAKKQGEAALRDFQANSREWAGYAQDSYKANSRALQALLGCKTLEGAMTIQGQLMQEQLKLLTEHGARVMAAFSPGKFKAA